MSLSRRFGGRSRPWAASHVASHLRRWSVASEIGGLGLRSASNARKVGALVEENDRSPVIGKIGEGERDERTIDELGEMGLRVEGHVVAH